MGRDKATMPVAGVPMAARVARALEAGGCSPVVLVGGGDALDALGWPWVADLHPGEGPVGGLLTALAAVGGDDVLVAACDLPDLDAATVATVLAAAASNPGAEVVAAETERLEPMLAWWPATSTPLVQERFDRGVRALHDVIGGLAAVRQAVPAGALRNVNRPGDAALARRRGPGRGEHAE
jgi:molybdopterin-guanine dinucleotide biosynthesis protein A